MSPFVAAIVPAAGSGLRLAVDDAPAGELIEPALPKALRPLAGISLLRRSVLVLQPYVAHVVVVAPAGWTSRAGAELAGLEVPALVVEGGGTRQESVRRGLGEVPPHADVVLVHDAARPLVPLQVVARVVEAVAAGAPAVVPCVPVADSLRMSDADGSTRALDRAGVLAVQTPQGFAAATLRRAHAAADASDATDDAGLVERLGVPVRTVTGDRLAFKITSSVDLLLAEQLVVRATPSAGTSAQAVPPDPSR